MFLCVTCHMCLFNVVRCLNVPIYCIFISKMYDNNNNVGDDYGNLSLFWWFYCSFAYCFYCYTSWYPNSESFWSEMCAGYNPNSQETPFWPSIRSVALMLSKRCVFFCNNKHTNVKNKNKSNIDVALCLKRQNMCNLSMYEMC